MEQQASEIYAYYCHKYIYDGSKIRLHLWHVICTNLEMLHFQKYIYIDKSLSFSLTIIQSRNILSIPEFVNSDLFNFFCEVGMEAVIMYYRNEINNLVYNNYLFISY